MRVIVSALVLIFGLVFSAQAQESEIENVINKQIEAFKADDFESAFAFASPSIRKIFRTSENFGRMVTNTYPMVWRPSKVTYLDLREIGGDLWQKIEVIDMAGRVHCLDYWMKKTADGWKINAVQFVKGAGVSA